MLVTFSILTNSKLARLALAILTRNLTYVTLSQPTYKKVNGTLNENSGYCYKQLGIETFFDCHIASK